MLRVLIVLFCFCLHTDSLFGDDISVEHVCSDQKLDLRINGGIQPYEVLWQGFSGGMYSDISGWPKSNLDGQDGQEDLVGALHFTKYKVIVTDELCGTAVYEIEVDPCKCLKVNLEWKQNVTECSYPEFQTNSGALTISVTGTNDYNVRWSNGSTNTSINKLITGQYTVTVTSGACRIVRTYQICCCGTAGGMQPPNSPPVILCPESGDLEITNENVNSPTNSTSFDGSISISVNGASSITWYGPNGPIGYGNSISGLGPGEYCAQIFDGCGNAIDKCYELVDCSTNPITINGTVTNTCSGYSVGSIYLNVTGGNPVYRYNWSNGRTNPNILGLSVGQYCVTITDTKGCESISCFTVNSNSGNLTTVGCKEYCNGIQVNDYGPPITIENPNNCLQSLITCTYNQSIQSPPFTDNSIHLDIETCYAEFKNNASRNVCFTALGNQCTDCSFFYRAPNVYNCSWDYCVFPTLGISIIYRYNNLPESVVYWPIYDVNEGEDPVPVFTGNCIVQIYDQCTDPHNHQFQTIIRCPGEVQYTYQEGNCYDVGAYGVVSGILPCRNWIPPMENEEASYGIEVFNNLEIGNNNQLDLIALKTNNSNSEIKINTFTQLHKIDSCHLILDLISEKELISKIYIFDKEEKYSVFSKSIKLITGLNNIHLSSEVFDKLTNNKDYTILIEGIGLYYPIEFNNECSINKPAPNNIIVKPNPSNETISIEHDEKPYIRIEIIDALGNSVIEPSNLTNINISNLKSGIYFIKIHYPKQTLLSKFIKI